MMSFHGDLRGAGLVEAVVACPLEVDRAALGRRREEADERIRGDCRMEVGAEDLLAVIGAPEGRDDVARDRLADIVMPEAGFHDVRDQRLDLDGLAAGGFGRHVDQGAGHQSKLSRQAARVTMTSAEADQNEPSLISATAMTVCVSARRKRVEILARPARGPRCTLITLGSGFFSLKTWIALTWSSLVIGLSTSIASATVLPFSTSA